MHVDYNEALAACEANYVPLSPLSFLRRTGKVFGHRTSLIQDDRRYTWAETHERCRRFAAALQGLGIGKGDTVAALLPNIIAMYEAHFAVPMLGAVLNGINIRLDAAAIAFILDHSESRVLLVDPEFAAVAKEAVSLMKGDAPTLITVVDEAAGFTERLGELEYEAFIAAAEPLSDIPLPDNEWDAIALGYTSGTTGNPKGVVTHHRGAYLNAVSNTMAWSLPASVTYLWTLPMFHCNGWCFPWTVAALGGTNVCLRRVDAQVIADLIREHGVTHFCGAPIVHSMISELPKETFEGLGRVVKGLVAGAPPPASVFERMRALGFEVTHVYGLTEVYGPAVVCTPQQEWADKPAAEQIELAGRQGVNYPLEEDVVVMDPDTMTEVPHDGETIGEVMFRGNIVMKGYLKNPEATTEAFKDGWFHSGDLAVVYPDGYLKIRDRSKDVIISGGENIASLEVEEALQAHPEVLVSAVVAMKHEKWGEVPAAYVQLRPGSRLEAAELKEFCKAHLPGFKVPKKFVIGPIPTTSTGKIQKFKLREKVID
ncbi:acyl-CoA synthetase [Granulosicoccaceae sp. 1_MG-2023]|nr:acyl-CoA synthetase [Granulosicoccaceae sp. 1_MG-2023]